MCSIVGLRFRPIYSPILENVITTVVYQSERITNLLAAQRNDKR